MKNIRGAFHILANNRSNRRNTKRIQQITIDRFVVLDRFGERNVNDLIILDTHHHVTLIIQQGVDRSHDPMRVRQDPILCRRRTTAPASDLR